MNKIKEGRELQNYYVEYYAWCKSFIDWVREEGDRLNSTSGGSPQRVSAASGEEGLRIAADSRPSAVIVNGTMPGIDGATVIRLVHEHLRTGTAELVLDHA